MEVLWKQRSFLKSTGIPIKNGQEINELLTTIVLPSEIVIIKIEAHTEKTESEYQANTLVDSQAKAAVTESIKVVAHVNEIHLLWQKKDSLLPDFCHLMSLQHGNSLLLNQRKLRWANNGCKFNEQQGVWETQDGHFVLPSSLANHSFLFPYSSTHSGAIKITHIINKH